MTLRSGGASAGDSLGQIIEAQIDEELAGLKLEHAEGREQIQESLSASEMKLYNI